jgi:hypothetical protein
MLRVRALRSTPQAARLHKRDCQVLCVSGLDGRVSSSPALGAGTKRVRELVHRRARVSMLKGRETRQIQRERALERPRVPAWPSLVVLS